MSVSKSHLLTRSFKSKLRLKIKIDDQKREALNGILQRANIFFPKNGASFVDSVIKLVSPSTALFAVYLSRNMIFLPSLKAYFGSCLLLLLGGRVNKEILLKYKILKMM